MAKESAISIKNLTKTYKTGIKRRSIKAVDNLSLEVPQGCVFGLLGPNGAGKTTTLKAILGFIQVDQGNIQIFGQPNTSIKSHQYVGFLPEQPYFHLHLTPAEILDFFGKLFRLPQKTRQERAENILELVGLSRYAEIPLSKFSKGMLQRLGIAQAMINNPDLLILDEPASGLDPIGQIDMRNIILSQKQAGKTILLSSHQLTEVEKICDFIAIIDEGRLMASGETQKLIREEQKVEINLVNVSPSLHLKLKPLALKKGKGKRATLLVNQKSLQRVIDQVRQDGAEIKSVIPQKKTLEDFFLETIGKEKSDAN